MLNSPILKIRLKFCLVFADIPDGRRAKGKRHQIPLCLALFTLAIVAGNQGFLAIGDWLASYRQELIALFKPPKNRLPSYSTIRRVLIPLDYKCYSGCLAKFFGIQPLPGETLAVDGKVLRGSYQLDLDNPDSEPLGKTCSNLPSPSPYGDATLMWLGGFD